MSRYFDCIVCQAAVRAHECEEVNVGGMRAYVCTDCGLSQQEALEIETPLPARAEIAPARVSLFERIFRRAA